eukprot:53480-Eustigmatos_ZCMA.PRE.1
MDTASSCWSDPWLSSFRSYHSVQNNYEQSSYSPTSTDDALLKVLRVWCGLNSCTSTSKVSRRRCPWMIYV